MQINFIEHKSVNLIPYILILIALVGLMVSVWFVLVPYMSFKSEVSSIEKHMAANIQAESEALKLEKQVEQHQQLSNYIANVEDRLIDSTVLIDELRTLMPDNSKLNHLHYIKDESIEITFISNKFTDMAIYNESLISQPYVTNVSFTYMERLEQGDFQATYLITINANEWMEVVQNGH